MCLYLAQIIKGGPFEMTQELLLTGGIFIQLFRIHYCCFNRPKPRLVVVLVVHVEAQPLLQSILIVHSYKMGDSVLDKNRKCIMSYDTVESPHFQHDLESSNIHCFLQRASRQPILEYMCRRTVNPFATLSKVLFRVGFVMLPSYLQWWISGRQGTRYLQTLHTTSPLDGLRGFACCVVFIYHSVTPFSQTFSHGYGVEGNGQLYQLPFIRLIHAGPAMVSIFFVISGYVLSYKPLKLLRRGSWDQAFHTISSSVFRRGLRLFTPAIASTFLTMLLVQRGLFDYADSKAVENTGSRLAKFELVAGRRDSFRKQFHHWLLSAWLMIDPFTWEEYHNPYNGHLYTVPIEFRSSLVLFLIIIALMRLRTRMRVILLGVLILSCVAYRQHGVALFLSGMFLGEVDLLSGTLDTMNQELMKCEQSKWRRMKRLAWVLAFIVGLYCASYPDRGGDATVGYRFLSRLSGDIGLESRKWWQLIGSVIVVWSVNNLNDIQPFFTNCFAQYLGKISFAVYIVHGPILHSVGLVAMTASWRYIGRETTTQNCLGFLVAAAVVLPTVFWIADIFWRLVDVPCTKFSRWVEDKVMADLAGD
jgi:peptidoglycan/LPS O-acetylase OafA/YrhL